MSFLIGASKRVLDPIDRVSEILFGLIMVLTFTGSLSVAEAGRDDVRTMLIGALGCNVAWGIIDAMLYLMGRLADTGRGLATYRAVHKAADSQTAQRLIADALPRAMPTERSSLFLRAPENAAAISAAAPTSDTTMNPTNAGVMPRSWAAAWTDSTKISLTRATKTVTPARIASARPIGHAASS